MNKYKAQWQKLEKEFKPDGTTPYWYALLTARMKGIIQETELDWFSKLRNLLQKKF